MSSAVSGGVLDARMYWENMIDKLRFTRGRSNALITRCPAIFLLAGEKDGTKTIYTELTRAEEILLLLLTRRVHVARS